MVDAFESLSPANIAAARLIVVVVSVRVCNPFKQFDLVRCTK